MLILASRSPRRSEILRHAGIEFIATAADVDESVHSAENPEDYVKRVAQLKALAVKGGEGDIVLGADTVVVIDGEILGKPKDRADAVRMLKSLADRKHEVVTGVCSRRGEELTVDWAVTKVWVIALTQGEIDDYVASGEPMDKAGAYAIQGLASKFIERIDGSYSNVVGLPVELVYKHLRITRGGADAPVRAGPPGPVPPTWASAAVRGDRPTWQRFHQPDPLGGESQPAARPAPEKPRAARLRR
jgi:septum formation protein